jgi:glycerol-3-phosphate O-acyltransferase
VVLPVPLAAATLLEAGSSGLELDAWRAAFYRELDALRKRGACVVPASDTRDVAFRAAVQMLRLRHLIVETDGRSGIAPGAEPLLAYYANSILLAGVSQSAERTAA